MPLSAARPDFRPEVAQRHDGQAAVNKKGQTLLQRHAGHSVTRESRQEPGRMLTYSTSYEAKRIDMIREALAHLTDGLN